jgi:GT2 family glycosyltransferase
VRIRSVTTVAVIVPTFRRQGLLNALLASLFAGEQTPDEVIVVDNDPLGSCECQWPREWPIQVIHAGLGLNLAGARNRGWRSAHSDLCFFVDDDNTVDLGTIQLLAAASQDASIGLLAPVIYESTNPASVWCGGIYRSMWTTKTTFILQGHSDLPTQASWPTLEMPDAFAVPRSVLNQIGGFDETRYPFHYDEADLGQRIRAGGLSTIVVRAAGVYHNRGDAPGAEMMRAYELNGERRVEMMVSARVRFHRQYSGPVQRLVALGVFIPIYSAVLAFNCLMSSGAMARKATVIRAIFRGVIRGFRGIV